MLLFGGGGSMPPRTSHPVTAPVRLSRHVLSDVEWSDETGPTGAPQGGTQEVGAPQDGTQQSGALQNDAHQSGALQNGAPQVGVAWLDEAEVRRRRRLATRVAAAAAVLAVLATVAAIVAASGGGDRLEATASTSPTTARPSPELDSPAFGASGADELRATTGDSSASTEELPSTESSEAVSTSEAGDASTGTGAGSPEATPADGTPDPTSSETTAATQDTATSDSSPTSATSIEESSTTSEQAPPAACWDLVLDENFNGSSLDSAVWTAYNSEGNAGFGLRRPSAVSVADGVLTITAQMQDGNLVSGGLSHGYDQAYGRYEVRVRTDQDPSETMSGVVLTWPASNVHPRDGENNIYETLATPGDRSEFYTFIHKPFGTADDQDYTAHAADGSAWHTMAMEWTPEEIRIYRDGTLVKTLAETSADLIPDVAHFAAIQLDAWKATLAEPVSMQVDYIKVHSYNEGC
jgi:beta-glucanase (GH16 family)